MSALQKTKLLLKNNYRNFLLLSVVFALGANAYFLYSLNRGVRSVDCVSSYEFIDLQNSVDSQEEMLDDIKSDIDDIHDEIVKPLPLIPPSRSFAPPLSPLY